MVSTCNKMEESLSDLRQNYQDGMTQGFDWRKFQLEGILKMLVENERKCSLALHEDLGKGAVEANKDELGYTKKQEERHFHGVITLEECNIKEIPDEEESSSKSLKDKKANGPDSVKGPSLLFKLTSKVPYKTVLKAHSVVVLKAESKVDKVEWCNKLMKIAQPIKGSPGGESGIGNSMRQSLSDGSLVRFGLLWFINLYDGRRSNCGIQWLEDLQIPRKIFDGCHRKCVDMLKRL